MDYLEALRSGLVDRYTIERELGRGGMAVVYLARDLKHDRQVALKVLLPELSLAVRSERFLREIQIAAKLTHPHILPLYDSGEVNGVLYYVMPYVEGESLRDRLKREKQLSVDDALAITRDVAAALGHAHAHDVVHRDIKPENILLTRDGKPVVMDFGIARALMVAGGQTVTESGIAVGTPTYMSPEQASAGEVDARSDIYSLGCVLYEMLTGHPPFTGSTAQEILGRHALDPVPTVRAVRPNLPRAIEQTIEKALAKHPADRFVTASQFAEALRTSGRGVRSRRRTFAYSSLALAILLGGAVVASRVLRSAGGLPAEQSIAVLPFVNLSTDPENEYFSDGMTDELINALTQVEGLRVPARTSSFTFKGKNVEVVEIGRRLNVAHVLEGTVRRVGAQLRVTAQLVKASDGHNLWSQRYDRVLKNEANDVFAIQDEISRAIVGALQVKLSAGAAERLVPRSTKSLAAYDDYLRGRYFWSRQTRDGILKAMDYFRRAISQDSGFALAWSGLADAALQAGQFRYRSRAEAWQLADGAAVQAVRLDSNLAEARLSLGRVYQNVHWDLPGAEQEYLHALRLNPKSSQAHSWYSALLTYLGKCDDAISEGETGIRMDPLDRSAQVSLGNALTLCARRYDDAIEQYGRSLELAPEWATAHGQLGLAYLGKNLNQEAAEQFRSALRLNPNNLVHAGRVAYARARLGHRDEALAVLRDLLHRLPDPTVFYPLAELYMGLGNHDAALRYLDSAVAAHEILLGPLQSVIWDPVRSDPRFRAQLRKMGTVP